MLFPGDVTNVQSHLNVPPYHVEQFVFKLFAHVCYICPWSAVRDDVLMITGHSEVDGPRDSDMNVPPRELCVVCQDLRYWSVMLIIMFWL